MNDILYMFKLMWYLLVKFKLFLELLVYIVVYEYVCICIKFDN